jgi:Leucine-rich repeat (LRR) protein
VNDLVLSNKKAVVLLKKSESLLNVTRNILKPSDDQWADFLLRWFKENIEQESSQYPKSKKDLLKITTLYLRWNRLQEVPKELFNLKQLEILELNNNSLSFLPKELGCLKRLRILNLNINNLTKLPAEIVNLNRLELINIKNNKRLELSTEQIDWLNELYRNGCTVTYDKYKFMLGE